MTENAMIPYKAMRRGALKTRISTSEPTVDSSRDFSIFVVIENPYDIPITIYSVQTHLPVELLDSAWLQKYLAAQFSEHRNNLKALDGLKKRKTQFKFFLMQLKQWFIPPEGPRIAEAIGTEIKLQTSVPTTSEPTINIHGDCTSSNLVTGAFSELWYLDFPQNPTNDELDKIFMKVDDYRSRKFPVILQPGNSVVKQFVLRAKRSLFFKPITYNFQIQIKYAVDGEENFETTPYNLDIRAALNSTITGGFIGGIIGVVARTLNNETSLTFGTVALAAIFGTVAVVAFARKESAQPIVTIEDFWGGLLIGFLVGFVGENSFKQIIGVD